MQVRKQTESQFKLVPLKRITRLEYGESLEARKRIEDGDVPVYGSNGAVGFHNTAITLAPAIVIGRKGSFGKISYSDIPCFPIDTTYYIDSRHTSQNLRWLYYQLSVLGLDEYSQDTGVPGLSREHAYSKMCHLPSLEEQQAIASFLDRETAKLDQLVEKKQRLIELLQEYRQALITQAVTKGLDPNVPMKDSGIPWLGEVPAHWKVTKIKYVSSKIGSGKTPKGGSEAYVDSGVLFIRSQNVHFDGLRLEDVVYIDEETNNEMSGTQVRDNDVLLNITGASIGRCCLVPEGFPRANVNQHVCIIRPITTKILPGFLHAVVCSEAVQHQIDIINHGTSREGLNFDQTGNLVFAYPEDLEEQRGIYQFIVDNTNRIDSLVAKLRLQIEKIQEYRRALISAAVTGQIDVRKSLAEEPEGVTS